MTNTTKRIQTVARKAAKAIIELRAQGLLSSAQSVEADATRTIELIRTGQM